MNLFKLFMILLLIIILIIYYNIYIYKRIKRRYRIKGMEVDEKINSIIDEIKQETRNNRKLKAIQNKMRFLQIMKHIFEFSIPLGPFIYLGYILYKYGIKGIMSADITIQDKPKILITIIVAIVFFIIIKINIENNRKSKEYVKRQVYIDFLKRINYKINWKEEYGIFSLQTNYRRASFNYIEPIKEENLFGRPIDLDFEDSLSGTYKENYKITISDFKEINRGSRSVPDRIKMEGIFCVVKIDKNILNDVIITNNKKSSLFMEKQYIVTNMPDQFYSNFTMLAKNRLEISEKISAKSIQMIEDFYNKSKIDFDIAIRNDQINFRFKTIDTMEVNTWGNIVDEVMLKEYANILTFVVSLSEEINENWK